MKQTTGKDAVDSEEGRAHLFTVESTVKVSNNDIQHAAEKFVIDEY